MEKIVYEITAQDGEQWKTPDIDIARTAYDKACQVVEYREYSTYSEHTVVRLTVATEWTTNN